MGSPTNGARLLAAITNSACRRDMSVTARKESRSTLSLRSVVSQQQRKATCSRHISLLSSSHFWDRCLCVSLGVLIQSNTDFVSAVHKVNKVTSPRQINVVPTLQQRA